MIFFELKKQDITKNNVLVLTLYFSFHVLGDKWYYQRWFCTL